MKAFLNGSEFDLTSIKEVDSSFDLNTVFSGWKKSITQKPKNAPDTASSFAIYKQVYFDAGTILEIAISLYDNAYTTGDIHGAIYLRSMGESMWSSWRKI